MKRLLTLIYFIICLTVLGQTPANDPHWILQWEDGFDDNTIDLNKWTVVDWAHGNSQTIYLKENVKQENGNLVLTVNSNDVLCYSGHPPTIYGAREPCHPNILYNNNSGWIETNEVFNLKYGYIEARVKVPFGYGFFPGFWTFIGPGNFPSTNAAEIDIFEMTEWSDASNGNYFTPNVMTTNIHTEYPDITKKGSANVIFDFRQWHTYGIEWSPSKIIWYVDGYPVRNFPNHNVIDYVRFLFNLAIEPNNGPNITTPFPASMYVDYIKTYKLANDCNTVLNVCNYNFMLHDNYVKKNIVIGNNNCTNSLINGQKIFLRASEGILLNGDFTVPLGAEIYLDVNNCY